MDYLENVFEDVPDVPEAEEEEPQQESGDD
jgi:hypothetical protein